MIAVLAAVTSVYLIIAFALVIRRTLLIIDLYDESVIVRSREQKSHIRQHAIHLRDNYKNDLLWVKLIFVNTLKVNNWLKSA